MTGSALAATLAQPCSPLHGTIRGSGHATPTNNSRASTPVRTRRAVVRAATVGENRHAPPEPEPEAVRPPLGTRSNSAHSLNAEPPGATRRRRLSIATYGDGSEDGPAGEHGSQSNAVNASSFLDDSRSSVSRRNTAMSEAEDATPSTCVMGLTLPVDAYAVVGPDTSVAAAAALAGQDPALRCVVVAAAGMGATHVLDRKVVEQIGRYSRDPGGESLASYLSAAPPSASAGPTATVAAAAGLLLSRGGDYLPVVDEGIFLGLLSRGDVARVMLAGNPDVFGADLEPRASAGGMTQAAAAALAAATTGPANSSSSHDLRHYDHDHVGALPAGAAAAGLALGAAGGAALSLGPPAPSGCLDSAEVARVTRGTLYCSTQQHQLDLAAEAAHEAVAAAATAATAATAAEGDTTATAGATATGVSGLFPAELLSSLGALGLAPDFAAAAETFEAAASSGGAAAALQLRQQAILQKAAAAAMAAVAATTGPEALAAATAASHAFSPQHTTLQLDAAAAAEGAFAEGTDGGALLLTPATSESAAAAAAAAAASLANAASLHSHQISPSWSEAISSAIGIDLLASTQAAGAAVAADAADAAAGALGHHGGAAPAAQQQHHGSSSSHQAQGATAAAHHHGHGHGHGQAQGQGQAHGQAQSLESVDGHGHSTMSLRSVNDPLVSGWDMLDNVDDAMDVLGLVGKTMNAEAVARQLLGELAGAAAAAGGTSSTGWAFKYLYDGDCAICRTFQACLDKLDGGAGKLAFVDISAAYNAVDHGGINFKAAMETVHILSANGQIFKGLTAVLKLLVAVDPAVAAHLGSLTALLPLLSLSYMLISKNRHRLAPIWTAIVRTTKVDQAIFGRDIMEGLPPITFSLPQMPQLPQIQLPHLPGSRGANAAAPGSPRGSGSGAAGVQKQQHQQHKDEARRSGYQQQQQQQQQQQAGVPVPVPVPVGLSGGGLGGMGGRAGPGGRH